MLTLNTQRRRFVVAAVVVLLLLATAPAAQAEKRWVFGTSQSTWVPQCFTGMMGWGSTAYVAVFMDPASPPAVGEPFDVAVRATSVGHPCGEPQWAGIHFALPAGVEPADGIECFIGDMNRNYESRLYSGCPAAVVPTSDGWLLPWGGHGSGYWPLAMDVRTNTLAPQITWDNSAYINADGVWVEAQLNVVATRRLDSELIATPVRIIDGGGDPWLRNVSVPVTVTGGAGPRPRPSPSPTPGTRPGASPGSPPGAAADRSRIW